MVTAQIVGEVLAITLPEAKMVYLVCGLYHSERGDEIEKQLGWHSLPVWPQGINTSFVSILYAYNG